MDFDDIINDIDTGVKFYTKLRRMNEVRDIGRKRHEASFMRDIWASSYGMSLVEISDYIEIRWAEMGMLN